MSIQDSLAQKIPQGVTNQVTGQWQAIRLCPDIAADEWLNVGVFFQASTGSRYVKMLDNFERLQCLYDKELSEHDLYVMFEHMEETLTRYGVEALNNSFAPHSHVNNLLYAAGDSVESILDGFYKTVVTLGKPRTKKHIERFSYVSNTKLRTAIFDKMLNRMPMLAEATIQYNPFTVHIDKERYIDTHISLVGPKALGHVASAYHKSSVVIENHIMQAVSELTIARNYSDRKTATLSILTPGEASGLTLKEFNKIQDVVYKHLSTADALGIEIILDHTTDEVAKKTADRWIELAA